MTKSRATPLGPIYVNSKSRVAGVKLVQSIISDHCAASRSWSVKLSKSVLKRRTIFTFQSLRLFRVMCND